MRDNSPIISIIIPVYNAENTIRPCLDSIVQQSYTNLEILLVDDGSQDNSLSIIGEYARYDSRIQVIAQSNMGVSAARNAALSRASGQYLQFVDSDDTLPHYATAALVHTMEAHHCDMVIGRYLEIIQNSSRLRGYIKTDMVLNQSSLLQKLSLHPNSFYYAVLWNKLYRRDLVVQNAICFDPSLPWGEDFAFNMHYMQYVQTVTILSQPVYKYTRNLNGLALTTGRYAIIHPIASMRIKLTLLNHYKNLFIKTGHYYAYRRILPRYLFSVTLND